MNNIKEFYDNLKRYIKATKDKDTLMKFKKRAFKFASKINDSVDRNKAMKEYTVIVKMIRKQLKNLN